MSLLTRTKAIKKLIYSSSVLNVLNNIVIELKFSQCTDKIFSLQKNDSCKIRLWKYTFDFLITDYV